MQKIILAIMDGWGVAPPGPGNAPSQASIPNLKRINNYYPATILNASGISVGLPWWEEGNSEVGHLTLGCGQIIYQYLPRIITAIQDGSFFKNIAFREARDHIQKGHSRLHLMGLVSSGAIHSYIDHLYALLEFCRKEGIKDVYLHIFTDGRDASPTEAKILIQNLKERIILQKTGKIATISGRSFAMDRDKNWDRIKQTYQCMVDGKGEKAPNVIEHLKSCYRNKITDEYIKPAVVNLDGLIRENDAVIFFNFRKDRAQELTTAFTEDNFKEFQRKKIKNLYFATLTKHTENPEIPVAFDPPEIKNCLGKVISDAKLLQFRIAETEKYAHVTYFFNGLREKPFIREVRKIIPSTGGPHYDRNPEMQAPNITKAVLDKIEQEKYHFILINLANPDMIGHTGNIKAAVKAAEVVDKCIGQIAKEVLKKDYILLITADHGNFEEMLTKSGKINCEHSSNPVPFYLVSNKFKNETAKEKKLENIIKPEKSLVDIAPTILKYLSLEKPAEMTGSSLLSNLIFSI